jgi:hypothetical protein
MYFLDMSLMESMRDILPLKKDNKQSVMFKHMENMLKAFYHIHYHNY